MIKNKQFLVLLGEEDSHLAEIYRNFFKKESIKLVVEKRGEVILEAVKKKKPDVVILETSLPEISGFEILERIRSAKATRNLPIILLTTIGQKEDVEKAMSLGTTEYLLKSDTKPVDLVNRVKKILNIEK